MTAPELQESVHRLPDDTVVIYLGFFRDRPGKRLDGREFFPSFANSLDLSVYTMWKYYMGLNSLEGVVTIGEHQGAYAARMLPSDRLNDLEKAVISGNPERI